MIPTEILRRFSFFTLGGETALSSMGEIAQEVTYEEGDVLFEQGDEATLVYVVVEGEIGVVQVLTGRGPVHVDKVCPGEMLGWSALTDHRVRRSRCVALRPSRLAAFEASQVRELMGDNPELGYHLMRQLSATIERRLGGAWVHLLPPKDAEAAQGEVAVKARRARGVAEEPRD